MSASRGTPHRNVLAALGADQPPCAECPAAMRCERQAIACADFAAWLATGRVTHQDRLPTKQIYSGIYRNQKETRLAGRAQECVNQVIDDAKLPD